MTNVSFFLSCCWFCCSWYTQSKRANLWRSLLSLSLSLSRLYVLQLFISSISKTNFDCPVACQNFSLLATAHDSETGLLLRIYGCQLYQISCFPSGDVSKHCSWYEEKFDLLNSPFWITDGTNKLEAAVVVHRNTFTSLVKIHTFNEQEFKTQDFWHIT